MRCARTSEAPLRFLRQYNHRRCCCESRMPGGQRRRLYDADAQVLLLPVPVLVLALASRAVRWVDDEKRLGKVGRDSAGLAHAAEWFKVAGPGKKCAGCSIGEQRKKHSLSLEEWAYVEHRGCNFLHLSQTCTPTLTYVGPAWEAPGTPGSTGAM